MRKKLDTTAPGQMIFRPEQPSAAQLAAGLLIFLGCLITIVWGIWHFGTSDEDDRLLSLLAIFVGFGLFLFGLAQLLEAWGKRSLTFVADASGVEIQYLGTIRRKIPWYQILEIAVVHGPCEAESDVNDSISFGGPYGLYLSTRLDDSMDLSRKQGEILNMDISPKNLDCIAHATIFHLYTAEHASKVQRICDQLVQLKNKSEVLDITDG